MCVESTRDFAHNQRTGCHDGQVFSWLKGVPLMGNSVAENWLLDTTFVRPAYGRSIAVLSMPQPRVWLIKQVTL
jgi:hypothetical protein